MTSHAQELGDMTRRRRARDMAGSMLNALEDAKLTHGLGASLNKIAYHVTGLGIMTQRGRRWSGQTISNVLNIADIQNVSITHAWQRIQSVYGPDGVVPDARILKWWREALTQEVAEVVALGDAIAAKMSRPPSSQPRPVIR